MQAQPEQADQAEVERFLRVITEGWDELADEQPQIELRCIGLNGAISVARFPHNMIEDAAQHAAAMNQHKQNVYLCVNPVRPNAAGGKAAKDEDILAAFFCFADADNNESMANVTSFAGPKFTMSVRTGTVPYLRGHAYWRLEDGPVRNLDAWRKVQRSIAASLQTDPVVVNPSRIMRVAGTMSWPPERKRMKGYVPELVTMRTEFSTDRDPVPFERMRRAFPEDVSRHDTGDVRTSAVQIDLGQQAMDRAMAEADILAGNNWHQNVIRLVASYVSRGLTDQEIHALTDRFTANGYTVEDTRREVQTAIDGARAKGYAPTVDPVQERMAAQAAQQDETKDTWPTPVANFNAATLPRRRWIYDNVYIRGYLTVTASAGGIGKTSLALAEALSIATGKPLLGRPVKEQTNVWVVNLEDPLVEMQLRLAALMHHYGVTHDDIAGRLYMDGEDTIEITLAAETRDGVAVNDALLDAMTAKVREKRIGTTIIDPFVSTHAVNENSNVHIQMVVAMLRKLARETETAVHLVHHVRKGNGDDATVDSIRGANALIGAARAARVINRVSIDDAMKLGIEEEDATGMFRIDDAKANLAAPADKALHMRTIGVEIANGEWVGTVVNVQLPDLFAGITTEQTMQVQRAVGKAADDDPLRDSMQAKRWAGHVIGELLDIDTTDKAGKARVNGMIKQWLKTDVLRVERIKDGRLGREISVVVVGKWINRDEAGL